MRIRGPFKYEETIYVAKGELSLLVTEDDGSTTDLRASEGGLVAVHAGAEVRYGGTPGTCLVLSIAPIDWATRNPAR